MAMLLAKCANKSERVVSRSAAMLCRVASQVRGFYGSSRTGDRDYVGYSRNGRYCYMDCPIFPFPSVRFRSNTKDILALREREKGDWRCLSCEEKKTLYRASYNQTFAEFLHPTGEWKPIVGIGLILVSIAFWLQIFSNYFVYEPYPSTLSEASQKAQLRRILDLHMNPIDGISSKWDYNQDCWKSQSIKRPKTAKKDKKH